MNFLETKIIDTDRISIGNKFKLLLFFDTVNGKFPKIKISDKTKMAILSIARCNTTSVILTVIGLVFAYHILWR